MALVAPAAPVLHVPGVVAAGVVPLIVEHIVVQVLDIVITVPFLTVVLPVGAKVGVEQVAAPTGPHKNKNIASVFIATPLVDCVNDRNGIPSLNPVRAGRSNIKHISRGERCCRYSNRRR